MKKGYRYYINITNQCNTDCPFCCMFSSTKNNFYMDFETYQKILHRYKYTQVEVQLEGGEPLLHKNLYLFLEYAISNPYCGKVIILTNGLDLDKHIERLGMVFREASCKLEIKASVNYWLLQQDKEHIKKLAYYIFATEYMDNLSISLNVRKRKDFNENKDIDKWIDDEIKKYNLQDYSNSYYLQSYGKLKDSNYEKPTIVQNIEGWGVYAVDGRHFGQDLIARSEYEEKIIYYEHNKIPTL